MPCYNPLQGWYSRRVNPTGKRSIVFNREQGLVDRPVSLPCSKCIGCRLEHSRQWAIRCMHEASLYEDNCFVTLTYDDEFLPKGGTLVKEHVTQFMKRLRERFSSKTIRFYGCGEYGDEKFRPHYHLLLFNHIFEDEKLHSYSDTDFPLYTSDTCERIWKKGFCPIGRVSFESAAYVARYVTKKLNPGITEESKQAFEERYTTIDTDTGEIFHVLPEFARMSRNPGIGKPWLEKYSREVYSYDSVIVNGKEVKPPKYYDDQIGEEQIKDIKFRRVQKALEHVVDSRLDRLRVREKVKLAQVSMLKRSKE